MSGDALEKRRDVRALWRHADRGGHVRADARAVEHRLGGSEPDGRRGCGVSHDLPEEPESVFDQLRELESGSALAAGRHVSEAGRGGRFGQRAPDGHTMNAKFGGDLPDAHSLKCELDRSGSSSTRAVARAVAGGHLPRGSARTRRIARSAAGCHADGRPVERTSVLIALEELEAFGGGWVDGVEGPLGLGWLLFT